MRFRITEQLAGGTERRLIDPAALETAPILKERTRKAARRAAGEGPPRAVLFRLWHGRCAYCDRRLGRMTLDHLTPVARGGLSVPGNLCVACHTCNEWKGNRTPEELGHVAVRERAVRIADLFRMAVAGDREAQETLRAILGRELLSEWIGSPSGQELK